ncbi:putative asparagine--tRNA ligase [Dioscorea sansibarensis]
MASGELALTSHQPHRHSVERFKYSNRVVIKSILGRPDGGRGLAGERVVVGGWVKLFKEKPNKDASQAPTPAPVSTPAVVSVAHDLTCAEVLMSRMRVLRTLARIFGKEVSSTPPPPPPPKQPEITEKTPVVAVPTVAYLLVNDGSCVANLLVVVDSNMVHLVQVMAIGVSILVEGVLNQQSEPGKQVVELKAEKILHVGVVDSKNYPLAKAKISLESIRPFPHLRVRTTTVASITRMRSDVSHATHKFFQNMGFICVHMPIITTTGFKDHSRMFQVTTLFNRTDDKGKLSTVSDRENISLEVVKGAIREKSMRVDELKRSDSNKEVLLAALGDLQKANELALQLEEQWRSAYVAKMDFTKDFFSCEAYLSVSTRLHLESYACGLSSVYAVGPVFQANDSPSKKQLAEMWIVEVELAFAELGDILNLCLQDTMNCAEEFLKFLCQSILDNCLDDLKFLSKRVDKSCITRLQSLVSSAFARISYTEALENLEKATDKTFKTKVEWGINLSDEHERYLVDEIYKQPIIVYDYPKELKPFYVHVKDDGKTVSAFDIIAPKGGVLVRGSRKEERLDMITSRIQELGLPKEQYDWYLDLQRHGTVKHSGFSLAIEDLIMFAVGLEDIKDAIPFPRSCGYINA